MNQTSRVAPAAKVEEVAAAPETGGGVPWPDGFARMQLLVVRGGEPVEGAVVTISPEVEPVFDAELVGEGEALTDAEGLLVFYARPTRTMSLRAKEPVRGWVVDGVQTSGFAGKTRKITLEFQAAAGTSGVDILVVSERTGLPLEGVTIDLGLEDLHSASHASTDVEGLARVPAPAGRELTFELPGYGSKKITLAGDESDPLRVPLRPFITLHGTVRQFQEEGKWFRSRPTITALASYADDEDGVTTTVMHSGRVWPPASGVSRMEAGSDGAWSTHRLLVREDFDRIPEVEVTIHDGGSKRQLAILQDVAPGDTIQVLDPWSAALPWKVQVLHGNGTPVLLARLTLTFVGPSGGSVEVRPREDGWCLVPQAPRGEWEYTMLTPGTAPGSPITGRIAHDGSSGVIRCDGYRQVTAKVVIDTPPLKATLTASLVRAGAPVLDRNWGPFGERQPHASVVIRSDGIIKVDCVPMEGQWDIVVLDQGADGKEILRGSVPIGTEPLIMNLSASQLAPPRNGRSGPVRIRARGGVIDLEGLDLRDLLDDEDDSR